MGALTPGLRLAPTHPQPLRRQTVETRSYTRRGIGIAVAEAPPMRLLIAPALLLLASCAPSPAPPPQPPPEPPKKADTWTPQSPQEAWWEETPPCPEGTTLVGAPPPRGQTVQCLLPSGERHGRVSVWFPNGHEGTYGEYERDQRHGRWMHWLHGRKLMEGAYHTGRRHGTWAFFFDETSDFDVQGRMVRDQPVSVEVYNHGLLVRTDEGGAAPPEELQGGEQPTPPPDEAEPVATQPPP